MPVATGVQFLHVVCRQSGAVHHAVFKHVLHIIAAGFPHAHESAALSLVLAIVLYHYSVYTEPHIHTRRSICICTIAYHMGERNKQ